MRSVLFFLFIFLALGRSSASVTTADLEDVEFDIHGERRLFGFGSAWSNLLYKLRICGCRVENGSCQCHGPRKGPLRCRDYMYECTPSSSPDDGSDEVVSLCAGDEAAAAEEGGDQVDGGDEGQDEQGNVDGDNNGDGENNGDGDGDEAVVECEEVEVNGVDAVDAVDAVDGGDEYYQFEETGQAQRSAAHGSFFTNPWMYVAAGGAMTMAVMAVLYRQRQAMDDDKSTLGDASTAMLSGSGPVTVADRMAFEASLMESGQTRIDGQISPPPTFIELAGGSSPQPEPTMDYSEMPDEANNASIEVGKLRLG